MHRYAESILSLYSELMDSGCPEAGLIAVRRAYDLQRELFAALYTGSGKPHVSHGAGTASILLSIGAPFELLPAALLHNVYSLGNFGDSLGAARTERRRAEVRSAIGTFAELRVSRFFEMRWAPADIEGYLERFAALDEVARDTILIRLADELEHNLYAGLRYRENKAALKRALEWRAYVPVLATELGYPQLIERFDEAYSALDRSHVPDSLVFDPEGCYQPPRSGLVG